MKYVSKDIVADIAGNLKAAGKTVVFTNGCFDILHAGHVRYLNAARHMGDCLIVGLNSDSSVRSLKGSKRPINHEEDRAEVLSALASVDYVVLFNESTAENLIKLIKPSIYIKGGDYRVEDLPEYQIVSDYGGKTIIIPEVPGRSTTNIINRALECNN